MKETYYVIGIFVLTFLIGIFMWIKAGKMNYKKHKRNFENTNSSGVVGYERHKDYAKSHNQGTLIGCLGNAGALIAGLSLIVLVFLIYTLINRGY